MCFHSVQSKEAQELKNRFNAEIEDEFEPAEYNAFNYPKTPVIVSEDVETIKTYNWGLIPPWAKDDSIRSYTLNARMETLKEKPAFKSVIKNRCLVFADGFYEWQWLDEKGKNKQKYKVTLNNFEPFGFAGLWSHWIDKNTGELHRTYTIITTAANEFMSEIHNSKKRMPVILSRESEIDWLLGGELVMNNDNLTAEKV